MAGEIEVRRHGKVTKTVPGWQHGRPDERDYPGHESAQVEMLESIRNVLIDIKNSQMLQCDVRTMIQNIQYNTEQTLSARTEGARRRFPKIARNGITYHALIEQPSGHISRAST